VPLSEADESLLSKAAPLIQERLQLLGDAPNLLRFLFTDEIFYAEDALAGLPENTGVVLAASVGALELIPADEFSAAAVQEALAAALIDGLALKPRVAYGPLESQSVAAASRRRCSSRWSCWARRNRSGVCPRWRRSAPHSGRARFGRGAPVT
jgi:glutamyl-tRNA synthetase